MFYHFSSGRYTKILSKNQKLGFIGLGMVARYFSGYVFILKGNLELSVKSLYLPFSMKKFLRLFLSFKLKHVLNLNI